MQNTMSTSSTKLTLQSTLRLHTGRTIPRLGFGVYQSKGETCRASVTKALELGYRHVDTAMVYRNEQFVGQAVDESVVPRSEIYITTKIMHGNWQPADPDILGTLRQAVYKVQPAASAPNSDVKPYVDLFLIHAPTMGQAKREEIWAALAQLQKEGLTKDIGVSNFGVKHLQTLPGPKPVINQIQVHPWLQQQEIVNYCVANDIVVEAYSPLARGEPSKVNDPIVMRVAESHNKDPGAILVRWSLQKGYVPLPKSDTPSRIASNAEVFDFELSESDMADLDTLEMGADGAVTWNPVDVA